MSLFCTGFDYDIIFYVTKYGPGGKVNSKFTKTKGVGAIFSLTIFQFPFFFEIWKFHKTGSWLRNEKKKKKKKKQLSTFTKVGGKTLRNLFSQSVSTSGAFRVTFTKLKAGEDYLERIKFEIKIIENGSEEAKSLGEVLISKICTWLHVRHYRQILRTN